jgi:transaldolase / glucose-6-phosphate isomerase
MTKLHELHQLGQSVWLDYIRRQFLKDGGLQTAVEQGVRGVTSNPSIFEKAIAGSNDYDEAMKQLVSDGKSVEEIYEALVIEDIQQAADILRPVYDESNGDDGYVSLEVSPTLANNTHGTIDEAIRLFAEVNRPNVMIKVPATEAGIPAIRHLIGEGININVTLMFSLWDYDNVSEAYLSGLELLNQNGGDVSQVASVASFFVSRVETSIDKTLEEIGNTDLLGKIAVANTKAAYKRFQQTFSGERWQRLADKGARVQRPLWASTGTKNAAYSDVKYIDELIGEHTVNTVPPNTLDNFVDHGVVASTLADGLDEASDLIDQLEAMGVDYDGITETLQHDGVVAFAKAFEGLMASITEKREKIASGWSHLESDMGEYQAAIEAATSELRDKKIMKRIWSHDHTVWQDDPTEISNRLAWLNIMDSMSDNIGRMQHLTKAVIADGYTHVLLLGMGGSSLAPEVFSKVFGDERSGLELDVLDSTDPATVLAYDRALDIRKTLFIVATKSGGTAETLSFFKYFYNRALEILGSREAAGQHFVAITDPNSKLETIAEGYQFRATFLNNPNIGGRYSVLSYFGIVPAALIDVDVRKLLKRAQRMATNCDANNCPSEGDNNGGRLGAIMGVLANEGRDKLTLVLAPQISSFGDWVEQLIAESTGKLGKGILPVVGESLASPDAYGNDRLFVYIKLNGDDTHDTQIDALKAAGHPIVTLHLEDIYDLGGQFFLWEMATVVSGYFLGIQPFNQPNVESAKKVARAKIVEYQETGKLEELEVNFEADGIQVIGDIEADSIAEALKQFLENAVDGSYISVHAYVQATDATSQALKALQSKLRDKTKLATTVAYAPRFLHSTGQLHKGDAGQGLFIQFTSDMPEDVAIPDEAGEDASAMSFGTLKNAQALGDRQALLDANRHVIRFHLSDVVDGLNQLLELL